MLPYVAKQNTCANNKLFYTLEFTLKSSSQPNFYKYKGIASASQADDNPRLVLGPRNTHTEYFIQNTFPCINGK